MRFRDFRRLHDIVREKKVHPVILNQRHSGQVLCLAIDWACVLYFKQVLCLQRSAATTLILRTFGWNAELVVGARVLPFKSHAWVEIQGLVVNDKPYMQDIYEVMERC
jgi:hypothetical protein